MDDLTLFRFGAFFPRRRLLSAYRNLSRRVGTRSLARTVAYHDQSEATCVLAGKMSTLLGRSLLEKQTGALARGGAGYPLDVLNAISIISLINV